MECSGDDDHVAAATQYEFDQVCHLAMWQLDQTKPVVLIFPSSIPVSNYCLCASK